MPGEGPGVLARRGLQGLAGPWDGPAGGHCLMDGFGGAVPFYPALIKLLPAARCAMSV